MPQGNTLRIHYFEFRAMGSPCSMHVYAADVEQASTAISSAAKELQRLENKYSRYIKDNYLYNVNQAALMGESICIDDEFSSLLDFADTCYQQSNGLFDISSGILRRVWDFNSGTIPSDSDIEKTLESIGWQYIVRENQQITFTRKGMELDFGGIVKEYAADVCANICRDKGIHHGLIDLGGDIHVIGPHPDGSPWQIAIRNPRDKHNPLATVSISQGAIASSGDYERKIEIDGKRYCHILSPKTGWPVSGISAVSIIAPQCVAAGSACTIAMLKEEAGIQWLRELGADFIAVDINQEVSSQNLQGLCSISY